MSDNLSEETNAAAKLADLCGRLGGIAGSLVAVFNFSSVGISTVALGAATVGVSTWLDGTLAGGGALFVLSMGSKAEHLSYLEQSETLNLADYSRLIAKQPKLTA